MYYKTKTDFLPKLGILKCPVASLVHGTNIRERDIYTVTDKFEGDIYFVGDIHGRSPMLYELLYKSGFVMGKDIMVCTGDLCDRGNGNFNVLSRFFLDPTFLSVMGNHDMFLVASDLDNFSEEVINDQHLLSHIHVNTWLANGGYETIKGLNNSTLLIQSCGDKMCELAPFKIKFEFPNGKSIGVVHGNIRDFSDKPLGFDYTTKEAFQWCWDREIIDEDRAGSTEDCAGVDTLIVGHSTYDYAPDGKPVKCAMPRKVNNRYYLDTSFGQHSNMSMLRVDHTGEAKELISYSDIKD